MKKIIVVIIIFVLAIALKGKLKQDLNLKSGSIYTIYKNYCK